jgi:hypothetical protein
MGKLGRAEKHALLVGQLASVVAERQRDVEALVSRRRVLNARAYATAAVVAHVEALLALSMALEQRQGKPQHGGGEATSASSGQPRPGCSSSDTGESAATHVPQPTPAQDVQGELAQIMQQLRDETWSGAAVKVEPPSTSADTTASAGGCGAAAAGGCQPVVTLGWSPARAAQVAANIAGDLTTDGLRNKLRSLVSTAGCLLP